MLVKCKLLLRLWVTKKRELLYVRFNHVEAPKQEEPVSTYNFKALPLNKKVH